MAKINTTAKVKIKHTWQKTNETKREIYQLTASQQIRVTSIFHTQDGSILVTATEQDAAKLVTTTALLAAKKHDSCRPTCRKSKEEHHLH